MAAAAQQPQQPPPPPARPPLLRAVLRSGVRGVLLGGALYLAGDTASDLLTYSRLRAAAMALVEQDDALIALVGAPCAPGPWYAATLAFSHHERVAHCTFPLRGSRGGTDIAVKAGREAGFRSALLYNLLGTGTWRLLSCQAMVPAEGGLVAPRSLLPEHRAAAGAAGAAARGQQRAAAAAACQPCSQQQQQQQQQQQHLEQPLPRRGSWWWPWSRRGSDPQAVPAPQ